MEDLPLLLTITTPDQTRSVRCDAVNFYVPDSPTNPNAGGSIGIRRGHVDALMAVAAGRVSARVGGKTVLAVDTAPGFAVVRRDAVTIITDRVAEME
ncbi:MAG: hypothetical protein IJC15_06470 [Clostridia bacterium]|nr:hypothetical protein [Clostridia bacterium]